MPKATTLKSVSVEQDGSMPLVFGMDIVEDSETLFSNPLRRIVMPDGDVDQNLDEVSSYLELNGYPPISADQRQFVHDVYDAAQASVEVQAGRAKWIEAHPPQAAEPQPEQA